MNQVHPNIIVVGSSNTDLVVKTRHIPRPGETILGHGFAIVSGGKGANQAVAASRLGGSVALVARMGNDDFGDRALNNIRSQGVHVEFVVRDNLLPSGVALICISESGENSIVVAQGANAYLSPQDIEEANSAIENCTVVVSQFETSLETVARMVELARSAAKVIIINPAPAQSLPNGFLKGVDVITPNKEEAALLLGWNPEIMYDVKVLAKNLLLLDVEAVAITLGDQGVYAATSNGQSRHFPAHKVVVTDTTGAGDCFTGALAVYLSEGREFVEAVEFANAAAALSVTQFGAQINLPTRQEVVDFLGH